MLILYPDSAGSMYSQPDSAEHALLTLVMLCGYLHLHFSNCRALHLSISLLCLHLSRALHLSTSLSRSVSVHFLAMSVSVPCPASIHFLVMSASVPFPCLVLSISLPHVLSIVLSLSLLYLWHMSLSLSISCSLMSLYHSLFYLFHITIGDVYCMQKPRFT